MGNLYPPAKMANGISQARPLPDEACSEDDPDMDVVSLLQENARLRALVTQLSGLVLRHVFNDK